MSLLLLLVGAEGGGAPQPVAGGRRYFPTYGDRDEDEEPKPVQDDEWIMWWD